jgi:hypothetical protein
VITVYVNNLTAEHEKRRLLALMWAALGLAEAVRFKLIEDWPTANGRLSSAKSHFTSL